MTRAPKVLVVGGAPPAYDRVGTPSEAVQDALDEGHELDSHQLE